MKYKSFKLILTLVVLLIIASDVDAQRNTNRNRRNNRRNTQNQKPQVVNAPKDTTPELPKPQEIPIEVRPGANRWDTVPPQSEGRDDVIDRNLNKTRKPLKYEHIREDDVLFRVVVWREIDIREKMNASFKYTADEDVGNQRFIAILMNEIKQGNITAYDPLVDDRFTTPLTIEKASLQFSGGFDTVNQYDPNNPDIIVKKLVTPKEVLPDSIIKFRLKEEWIFDKESSRLFVRLKGIAPMKKLTLSDGTPILYDGQEQFSPMFWVHYPSIRETLSKYEVYNPRNPGLRMSWDDLFEARYFSSYIVKSQFNNFRDLDISGMIKDPILRLLEGENIRDKIFNYEQNLWQY